MTKNKVIKIRHEFVEEARIYANKSKSYTSNRHDFHKGTLKDKQQKMFEGKLGEKIFKEYMLENNILFFEDDSHYTKADDYDFKIKNYLVDVKTRTKKYHTRTLEMVEQFKNKPKDIYVSVRLYPEKYTGYIIGWVGKNDFKTINRIENQGYLDNYVFYDDDLRDIDELKIYI